MRELSCNSIWFILRGKPFIFAGNEFVELIILEADVLTSYSAISFSGVLFS